MKAYGYIHKIESDKSFVYFPALGSFGTMNYVNCNPKDIFEFEKIDDQLSYPKKCENLSQEWGKIIEVSSATLKVKLQNSINYTLPIHFFVKTIDELSIGQQVKTIKNSQGMIIYCEIVEPVQEPKEENDYPDTISKKHPLKSMKDSFKFNEKIKNSIKTLQNFYSSYRKIRGDGNCYYRAVGFAYIEYLSRGSCPTSKFIDYINTSSSEFRPVLKYLFEIKQRFGSAVDYCEELFSNRQNDLMLVKDIKDRVAKHLLNDPEKFKPFLTHSLEQEIQNVLEMGREAEGVPCSFMTEILGISIQNVLLDREGVVQNKILNDDSGNCIFLCLRTGHYDLLYTYEQDCEDFSKHPPNNSTNPELLILLLNHTKYLYEKLFTLSSNYNIRLGSYFPDSIPKIADFWQEFSKLSEKTSEAREISEKLLETVSEKNFISEVLGLCSYCLSSQSDFKLFCGHLMCKQDSFEGLKSSTKGLFLLNDFEGPPSECLVCKALLTTEDLKKILDKDFQLYESRRLERLQKLEEAEDRSKGLNFCKSCQKKKKQSEFNQHHLCICTSCIPSSLKNNSCIHCGKKFSRDYLKSLKLICALCELPSKTVIISHSSHIICENCEKQCLLSSKCLECAKALTSEEISLLSEKYFQSCFVCGKFLPEKNLGVKKCGCLVCDACFSRCLAENAGCCFVCGQRLAQAKTQCVICTDLFARDQMLTLNCDHFFCGECLRQHVNNSISEGQEKVSCPSCEEIIDGNIIFSLVDEKLWDIYNKASIRKHFRLVDCPKCESYFETQENIAKCISCKFKFCVGCKEPAHAGGCDDQKIKKIIKEIEDRGERVAQCPGCKIPYTKDEGCEHVACTNPQCATEFCFTCSCHRAPTLAHGNHYHREDCKFYGKFDGPDKFSEKCGRCKASGKLCKRPKKLKVARRFLPGEE